MTVYYSFRGPCVVGALWAISLGIAREPRPSNYPLLDSKYHQIRTIRFQLRAVGGSGRNLKAVGSKPPPKHEPLEQRGLLAGLAGLGPKVYGFVA